MLKSLFYIISSLVIAAIVTSASSIVKTEKLETKIIAIEKDSEKIDNMILKKLDSIDIKLDEFHKCN
jgi:hypothetical protein